MYGAAIVATPDLVPRSLLVPTGHTNLVVRYGPATIVWLLVLSSLVISDERLMGTATAAAATQSGKLMVRVTGLPTRQRPAVTVQGPGKRMLLTSRRLVLNAARPGRYVITVRPLRISRGRGAVRRGARVFPTRRRITVIVARGKTATVSVAYGTTVNPGVRKLPGGLLSVIGDPRNPTKLVYRNKRNVPGRGVILTAAPSSILPYGLIAKVTANKRAGDKRVLSVRLVPVAAAVPEFSFSGTAALKKGAGGLDHVARAAQAAPRATCNGPRLFDVGAKLDEFTIRRASAKARPAQMSFTMAVRTTERLGPRVAAAGVSCGWNIGTLGPWQGFIPTPIPGVVVPVYATIPVDAAASLQGSLSAFKINVASTSVLDLDVGQTNRFGFRQEGSNVWVDGALQLEGTAKISATLRLQMGVGNPKIGDLHVKAGFGPAATWKSGAGCDLDVALGSLSVGAKLGSLKAGTPPWSPFGIHLWHGCDTSPPPGTGSTGGAGGDGDGVFYGWTCALRSDGTPTCWGANDYGESAPPSRVLIQLARQSASASQTCGLAGDGSVVCWGKAYGLPPPGGTFAQITVGTFYVCGLRNDGQAVCWGDTTKLGAQPPAGAFTEIAAGSGHTCGLRNDGTAVCWGNNDQGQASPPAGTFTQIASGNFFSCALRSDGTAACWGGNGNLPAGGMFRQITAGSFHACGIRADGSVACWGDNSYGQLLAPAGVFTQISGGGGHSCGLRPGGGAACWGNNAYGQAAPPAESFTQVSAM